jgi:N6-L-threonylcarbamoyladenine synthase
LDFGYPGGPKVDKLAKEGKPCIDLPKPNVEGLDFSYSGLKTAIINLHHKNPNINKADLCSSFEKVATDELIDKTVKAIDETGLKKVVLAGGVSANSYIREEFRKIRREEKPKNVLSKFKFMHR